MKPTLSILIAALLAGCAPSSYESSLHLRAKYPNCDLTEAQPDIGEIRFYVRTQDGRVLYVRMTSSTSVLTEKTIFDAPTATRGVEQ